MNAARYATLRRLVLNRGEIDAREAAYWYRLAAASGQRVALARLGVLYATGPAGVAKNIQGAALLWRRAAAEGAGEAAYNLAYLYEKGIGVPSDTQAALRYYQRSARLNNKDAVAALKRFGAESVRAGQVVV